MIKIFECFRNVERINEFGIYCIKCLSNNKIYIGSTTRSFRLRLKRHRSDLIKQKHHSIYLQNSFNKYGKDDFEVTLLEYITDKSLVIKREQYYIDLLKPEFNIAPIAGSNLGIKRRPRKEDHTLKQVQSSRECIRENNKTGHTGIYYSEKDQDYRPSIQFNGVRSSLGSYKTLEEAVEVRRKAEEYFWNPVIEGLSKDLKVEVAKQYRLAETPKRSNTNIEGVIYSELKQHSVFITTMDNVAINLANYLSFEEALKLRKQAEQYFYSGGFTSLSIKQKEEAIKQYKDKLKTNKIKSGHQQIIWDKNSNKWIVKPKIDNKLIHLGSYKDLEEAVKVKKEALIYFNSNEFISNNLEVRLEAAKQYKNNIHKNNDLTRERGISFHKATECYRAYIYVNRKNISLGQYATKQLALSARKKAELIYKVS
jgi:group I intron endonuclease